MKKIAIFLIIVTFIGCQKSEESKVDVVPAAPTAPIAPTELKVTIVSKDQIDLTWKDNSNNETGFKIERKADAGSFIEIASTAADITSYSDKSVTLNTTNIYRVFSFNQVGKSVQNSNEQSIQTNTVPTLTTAPLTDILSTGAKSGGNVSSDGGAAVIARGVVWGTSTNPTIALTTKTSDGTGTGSFQSAITGLTVNTRYYVRAYATNSAGTSYGNEVSFSAFTFETVTGANGRIWMDRNLGATQVATSSTDVASYGDLYQWGRGPDGHQLRTSATTTARSSTDSPGNNLFITASSIPYDWRTTANNNLWQGLNGQNNPCPTGFRIPTEAEWDVERRRWLPANSAGAYASPLKLPLAGSRNTSDGSLDGVGTHGIYWSSSNTGITVTSISFAEKSLNWTGPYRSDAVSCRCIKD